VETAKPEESFIRDHLIEQQSHHLAAQFQSLFHPPLLLLSRPSQICPGAAQHAGDQVIADGQRRIDQLGPQSP
jgi:hypothetical protein